MNINININIIVAYCKNYGIGLNNKLPWSYPEDLKLFAKITKGDGNNAIIMGRKTHESIGKVLPKRHNLILSNTIQHIEGAHVCKNIENALELCKTLRADEIYVIGGGAVYEEVINKKLVHKIYATEINKEFECDTFFKLPETYKCINMQTGNNSDLKYKIYENYKS